ncbi:hypothetical protein ABT368_31760 [Streptomyces althioticus]|uniref:hypothetical protein n=1 Tax=Streptomyces althioticus TaxID=83380 RepID=UPI0013863117|nr:hypothetical protein [Streptomyces sp. SID6013]GGT78725.1 hypothetical protein GCM10010243_66440 [Streptomyces matensis]
MSEIYNPDPGFAVATLAEALHELVATHGPLPERETADWRLLLVPAAADVAPPGPVTVTLSVGPEVTRVEVARPADDTDDVEENPYEVPLPAEIVRPFTRLLMDLVYTEEQSAPGPARGVCQLCGGQGRALSIWRPR